MYYIIKSLRSTTGTGLCHWTHMKRVRRMVPTLSTIHHRMLGQVAVLTSQDIMIHRCRASNRRGMRLRTFRLFARTLVGLSRTYFVSIGGSYLILSVRRYSSQTCSRGTHLISVPSSSRVSLFSVVTHSSLLLFLSFPFPHTLWHL